MRALQIFPCDTTTVERQSWKPALNGHYHSTPVTLISWWTSSHHSCYFPVPFSISTYPCLHQFPLAAWFCLFWEQTRTEKGRQPETQGDREKAEDDKSDTKGQRDARRKREGRMRFSFSEKPLYSLALACYSKIPLVSQYPEKICYNHLVSLLHPSFIDLFQPSLFQLVSKYTIALPSELLSLCSHLSLFFHVFFLFTAHPNICASVSRFLSSSSVLLLNLMCSYILPSPITFPPSPSLAPGDLNYNM